MKHLYSCLTTILLIATSSTLSAQNYIELLNQCNNTTNGTEVFDFPNTPPPGTDGTLTLDLHGDFSSSGEFVDIYGENNYLIASNQTGVGDCGSPVTLTFTIPLNELQQWAADQTVTIEVSAANATTSVNSGLCTCTLGGSMSFQVEATLEYTPVTSPNDAGIASSIVPTDSTCAGNLPVEVVVKNYGINQVSPVTINWRVNGNLQTPVVYNGLLDTLNGAGSQTATVSLGNYNFNGQTTFEAWTSMPNNVTDTVTMNDSLTIEWYASDPQLDLPDIALCDGNFEILNAGTEWQSYLWNTNATAPSIVITTAGTYTVTVIDTFGCPAVDSANVESGATPVVNMGGSIEACDFATLNSGTPNGTYMWSDSSTTQSITVNESGQYLVTVTSAQGCIGSGGVEVTIHDSPEINLGPDATICVDLQESHILSAGNGYSLYQWTSGQNSSSITINASQGWPMGWNDFGLTVTDANGCTGKDSARVRLQNCIPQGLTSISDKAFELFPNPTQDFVTVNFANLADSRTISIYDLSGRMVQHTTNISGSRHIIDVQNIAPGTYQVVVESDDQSEFTTLIIQ